MLFSIGIPIFGFIQIALPFFILGTPISIVMLKTIGRARPAVFYTIVALTPFVVIIAINFIAPLIPTSSINRLSQLIGGPNSWLFNYFKNFIHLISMPYHEGLNAAPTAIAGAWFYRTLDDE